MAVQVEAGSLDPELRAFYAARQNQPLWITPEGSLSPAARTLVELVRTSAIDAVAPGTPSLVALAQAVGALDEAPSAAALAQAENALSRAFADYVIAMRRAPGAEMSYEHETLRASVPTAYRALEAAANAPSLAQYVGEMQWMHPLYAPLRRAVAVEGAADDLARQSLLSNLERVRAVPVPPARRHVLVDAASARLWMYEDGRAVDSMRVVVGKPSQPTPMMAGYIRQAIVNPYWNVPADLVRSKIAPSVVRRGVAYLKSSRYEVLADWGPTPELLDPAKVDWRAVASGAAEVRVRQLPSPGNAMGKVKFEFPNPRGIYLHDTPEKTLMLKDARQFSSGCIRLEDAERLGRWLLRAPLPEFADTPEQKVDLPQPVPVYITYLTAHAEGGQIALGLDPYGHDRPQETALAPLATPGAAVSR